MLQSTLPTTLKDSLIKSLPVRWSTLPGGVLCLLLATVAPSFAISDTGLEEHLRLRLETQREGIPLTVDDRRLQAIDALQDFYAERIYEPVWFADGRLLAPARAVPRILESATRDGLRPDDYAYTRLKQVVAAYQEGRVPLPPVELELALTDAILSYAGDMLRGRVDPERLHRNWESAPRQLDLARFLSEALDAGQLVSSLQNLAPDHPDYHQLRNLLQRYRRIDRAGGLTTVASGETLKPGMRSGRIAALRRRLKQSGDLSAAERATGPELFDDALESAVKRYQTRHGLEPDGVVGPATLGSLAIPAAQRVRAIEINMERWRWLPQNLGDHFITVNIAGFEMKLVDKGKVRMSMPVVVGKPYHATPVFTELMTYLVFSPYWNIPTGIASRVIVPNIRRNPEYLEQESIKVFRGWEQPARELDPASIDWSQVEAGRSPYRFRQEPGPNNALGGVKFMFPNKYQVYMHDTPARELFEHTSRDFSNGCIRLKEPLRLAEYLLREHDGWDAQRITAAAQRGQEQTVRLTRAWPVHVLYWTVWVGADGEVNFRPDVYGRDAELGKALYN